jgi:hypothetical protein
MTDQPALRCGGGCSQGEAGTTRWRSASPTDLQRAGYATDPAYADKLGRVINTTLRLQSSATCLIARALAEAPP